MKFPELFTALKNGAMVITVNQRLARTLSAKYVSACLSNGETVWPSATIISYEAWLLQSWQARFERADSDLDEYLITPDQSLLLWEKVIKNADESVLLNLPATAKAAAKAYTLAYQWGIDISPQKMTEKEDVIAFSAWRDQYQEMLNNNHWLDRAELIEKLGTSVEREGFTASDHCIFAGFEVFTHSQLALQASLEQQGVQLSQFDSSINQALAYQFSADDEHDELMCMAQWAKEQLDLQPSSSVGIIVPDLNAKHSAVEAAFQAVFYPDVIYASDIPLAKPYNVSLGKSLTDYPLITQAFRLLTLFNKGLALAEISALLGSPFIVAGESEWSDRGTFQAALCERGFLSLSLKQLTHRLQTEAFCPLLAAALQELTQLHLSKPNRTLASSWAVLFKAVLKAIGWQGERQISSVEYQLMQAWESVLQDFSCLDHVLAPINLDGAIAQLKKMASARVFQAETPPAAIQIMGLMEGAGHDFAALWVSGLDDLAWPAAASPNPFLPLTEQRQQGLIQASPDLQYLQAKTITAQWAKSAPCVVLSYPAFKAGVGCIASPLITEFESISKEALLVSAPLEPLASCLDKLTLEETDDNAGPAVDRETISKGGVSIIKDQSACPFKAFVQHRLKAKAIEEPEPGIDARLRGSLLHECLEGVWIRLKTQQQLLSLNQQQQHDVVKQVVMEVIERNSRFTPLLAGRFGVLEAERLTSMVSDWLEVDAEREPFAAIELEYRQQIKIGELMINTSIDRVDRLQDGSLAIIDYKTGTVSPSGWFSDRPDEPQLPLYSVYSDQKVQSIAFAQLKKAQQKYAGITNIDASFSALKPIEKEKASAQHWETQIARWKSILDRLAEEYMAGEAVVDPSKKACEYCELSAFCRINVNAKGLVNAE